MTDEQIFDSIIESLRMVANEDGNGFFDEEKKGITYILYISSGYRYSSNSYSVFAIPSKLEFVNSVRDKVGEEKINANSADAHDAAWELLINRYRVVHFDEC